jgi:hypothetical protein
MGFGRGILAGGAQFQGTDATEVGENEEFAHCSKSEVSPDHPVDRHGFNPRAVRAQLLQRNCNLKS